MSDKIVDVLVELFDWELVPVDEIDPNNADRYADPYVYLPPTWREYGDLVVVDRRRNRYQFIPSIGRCPEFGAHAVVALRMLADEIEVSLWERWDQDESAAHLLEFVSQYIDPAVVEELLNA